MKKTKFFSFRFSIFALALILAAIGGGLFLRMALAWVGGRAVPPNQNVAAPLNVGSAAQTKQGSLTIQQGSSLYVSANGRFYDDGTYMHYEGPHSFWITKNANRVYIYPSSIYIGPSGGSNVYFRGSTLTGNEWSLNATGNLDVDCITLGTSGQKCSWADIAGVTGSGSANYIPKWTSSSSLGNSQIYDNGTDVGIGTTGPGYKLDVAGTIRAKDVFGAGGKNLIIGDDTYLTDIDTANMLGIYGMQNSDRAGIRLGSDGSYIFGDNGNVGIGTAAPAYKLDVVSGGATTARFGTASTDTVVIGDGNGKLTVGTIDPVYNISGEKFATYTSGMTGLKEETTGNVNLQCEKGKCFSIIDFAKTEKGSDLWLFWKVTDFGKNWDNLIVLLTPQGNNKVWYELNPQEHQLLIYGEKEGRVSYRLTAPRFDHQKWSNLNSDKNVEGMEVEMKNE